MQQDCRREGIDDFVVVGAAHGAPAGGPVQDELASTASAPGSGNLLQKREARALDSKVKASTVMLQPATAETRSTQLSTEDQRSSETAGPRMDSTGT